MDAADDVCKSCGSPVQKMNRNWSKFAKISVITLIIAAFGAYILLYNLDVINPDTIGEIFGGAPTADEPTPLDVGYGGQEPEEPVGGQGEAATERRSEEEHQAILSSVLASVDAYMQDFSQFNPIISRMGYLHNVSSGEYVTIELLERLGYLSHEYLAEDMLILYLRPMDLVLFDEIAFDSTPPAGQMVSLTVFLGYETPIGIGLYSRFGSQIIFRENLNHLLVNEYNPDNGEIMRPTEQDVVYQAVVSMISDALPGADVFIRYLAVDEAHGFVAFSTAGDGHGIINYILALEYDGNELAGVRLLAAGFETTQHPKANINQAAPSFNFELMPDYDIASTSLLANDSPVFQDIFDTMIENGQIEEGGLPVFISATPAFAYIVLDYGDVFFGQYNDGWSVVAVGGWQVAQGLMADNVNNPPLYIIWQQ